VNQELYAGFRDAIVETVKDERVVGSKSTRPVPID